MKLNPSGIFKIKTLLLPVTILMLAGAGLLWAGNAYRSSHSANHEEILNPDTTVSGGKTDTTYNDYIRIAEAFFSKKDYHKALSAYQNAKRLKPGDQYANLQINKCLSMLKSQSAQDAEYQKIIASADKYFSEKDYFNAKASYQLALDSKPGDLYAKGKLQECMDRIRANKASNILYDVAIANADKYFQVKDYQKALEQYESAAKILPGDKVAKERINQIIKIMVDNEAREEAYRTAIQNGDKLFAARKYPNALTEFKNALAQKPEEKYPQEKIAELNEILAKQKDSDNNYKKALAIADQLFAEKQYEKARPAYEEAASIKPEETYPPRRITEIDGILAAAKKTKEDYDRYIAAADSFYVDKKYINAKSNYELALKVKPGEAYPKEMISKAENLLAGVQANEKSIEDAYRAAIASADKLFSEKDYQQARSGYESASGIKPAESYPATKIKEIDGILANLERQKQAELEAIALKQRREADSIEAARQALTLRQQRIADSTAAADKAAAEALAARQKAEADALALKQKREADSIAAAKTAFALRQQQIADSIAAAKNAFALRQQQIADSLAAAKKAADEAMALKQKREADSIAAAKNAFALRQQQITDSLAAAKKAADEALALKQKRETDSIAAAKAALALRQQQITDSLAAAKKAADEALALKQKRETDSIAAAKAALALRQQQIADSLAAAKKAADEALALKQKRETDSIAAAKAALALRQQQISDSLAAVKKAADEALALKQKREADSIAAAKAAFALRQQQIADSLAAAKKAADEALALRKKAEEEAAAAKALDDRYKTAIANGDRLLAAKNYDQARSAYTDASALKPAEQYPKEKIAQIEQTLADILRAKEIDEQYHNALSKADQLFYGNNLVQAREQYVAAAALKPAEAYPAGKIAAIDKTLASQKALDEKYTAAIASADKLFGEQAWEQAKTAYQSAAQIKTSEKYPKDQIAVIDKTIADIARQKSIEDKYNGSVAKADKLFAEKSYALAKVEYNNSLTIKPAETYPRDRITEIDGIIAELKRKDDEYSASITKANGLLAQKAYEDARNEYVHAGEIKPDEQFPKTKILEINNLLTELKGKKQTFDDLVVSGDQNFSQKNYKMAKESFRQALDIFPDESYPKQRLTRINAITDSIYRANKSLYDKAVADGDKAFTNLIFDKAIEAYTEASTYLPDESYPRDMIAKIKKTISENAMVDVLTTTTIIKGGAETRFPFPAVNIANRKNNYVYIKIRNLSDKQFNVLLRYGKDNQISGGAVIRNLESDSQTKDRLISFRDQDPWYRIDNNYISLYPQGGDVEVTFIQISRAAQ